MIGGKMSKIYKALEKAEREREKEIKEDFSFASETVEEEKRESQEMTADLPKSVGGDILSSIGFLFPTRIYGCRAVSKIEDLSS